MQEKSLIKKNILHFIEINGISKYKFYQKTGITRNVLDQNNGMSEENTARILAYFPEISAEWLITGKEPMLRDSDISDHRKETQGIPLIPIEAMAGFGEGETNIMEYDCERYDVPLFKGADFLISVKGSSMYPKYSSGDVVACKKLPVDTFFQWNKVYVLDTVQGALIKRIKRGCDDEHLLIVSENDRYEPFELHRSEVHSVALVIGVIRLE